MRKLIFFIIFIISSLSVQNASALLNMELTQGFAGALPIAIVPFAIQGQVPPEDVSAIIANDLKNSGRFKVISGNRLTKFPSDAREVQFKYFHQLGSDNIVVGKIQQMGSRYQVSVQLLDGIKASDGDPDRTIIFDRKFMSNSSDLRMLAHRISDTIYQQLTGVRGIFSTRLAYIVVQRNEKGRTKHILEVADQDGYNPRPLLVSNDPIMSPSWSPDGRKIAYVSFENKRASIYIEDVATGSRTLVSEFPGINGAPSFSPDGKKLALVLSKSGSPNIYTMDLRTRQLTQLTNDFYINTEPSWSPDGRSIIFTSNRGGSPQIYQLNIKTRVVSRVTYDGRYNARASYTPDGNHIVALNQEYGLFNIGILDLDSGVFRVLTNSGADNESPSTAPNGTMVLFGTLYKGKSVLGMVATDGSVQIRLPSRNGEVQDPAWSPFLS